MKRRERDEAGPAIGPVPSDEDAKRCVIAGLNDGFFPKPRLAAPRTRLKGAGC